VPSPATSALAAAAAAVKTPTAAIPAAAITDFIVVFTGFTGVVVTFTLYLSVE
jgi:hypothetical protein